MTLCFDHVHCSPLHDVSLRFDAGMIVGLAGPDGSGKGALLRLAAGRLHPEQGSVEVPPGAVLVEAGPGARARLEAAFAESPKILLIDQALSLTDAAFQLHAVQELCRLQRMGGIAIVASHDAAFLERACDIVVALEAGRIVEQGDPGLVLTRYRRRILASGRSEPGAAAPVSRHGDGRVEIRSIEILGEDGASSGAVRSGEMVTVRARLHFHEAVSDPVVGIQIRSRIGVVVYGTNTQLENLNIGARRAGETVGLEFHFRCELCPQEYTLTLASHDPDGTAHDWLEDALLFSVTDDRYTAGVSNLRAKATFYPG